MLWNYKACLSGDFMARFSTQPYFENNVEEFYSFYSHETFIISLHKYGATSAYLMHVKLW